jgi:NAD(P)-dependent dehydrogenase (short-subunit alcohol dehydrogenase family)
MQRWDLSGRLAVVTGGAGLLGEQHAAALAECGAVVAIADVDVERAREKAAMLSKEFGEGRVLGASLDVTDPGSVASLCQWVVDTHGGPHILINNAAIDAKVVGGAVDETSRLETFSVARWQKEIDVGLTGAFLCSQAFGSWMARHGGGVILNIASDLSVFAPDQRLYQVEGRPDDQQPVKPVTYSVVKTALIGLTRYLAVYWADKNVRVNALSPGGVYNGQPPEFVSRLTRLIPLARMADVEEYRAAIQFLCSDASRYMTGQNLVMDGGRSVW